MYESHETNVGQMVWHILLRDNSDLRGDAASVFRPIRTYLCKKKQGLKLRTPTEEGALSVVVNYMKQKSSGLYSLLEAPPSNFLAMIDLFITGINKYQQLAFDLKILSL